MFLYDIVMEIENMTDDKLIEPQQEQKFGAEYIGNLSTFLKRLYTIRQAYKTKTADLVHALILAENADVRHELTHQMQKLSIQSQIIDGLFWLEIKDDLAIEPCKYPGLCVTKGWRVFGLQEPEE